MFAERVDQAMRAIDCTGNIDAAIDGWRLIEIEGNASVFSREAESIATKWSGSPYEDLFSELIEAIEREFGYV